MSPEIVADLIISLILICVGIGLVLHGQKLKNNPPVKSNFSSPNAFIVLGVLMLSLQLIELAETYM